MPQEVTPDAGKGALGIWRTLAGPGHRARINRAIKLGLDLHSGNPTVWGRREACGNSPPKAARAAFLSRPPDSLGQ